MQMMKCGHTANSHTADGKPSCVLCAGFTPNAHIVMDEQIDLAGRNASCAECGRETVSRETLAFFGYRPNFITDTYYCGCHGWD